MLTLLSSTQVSEHHRSCTSHVLQAVGDLALKLMHSSRCRIDNLHALGVVADSRLLLEVAAHFVVLSGRILGIVQHQFWGQPSPFLRKTCTRMIHMLK